MGFGMGLMLGVSVMTAELNGRARPMRPGASCGAGCGWRCCTACHGALLVMAGPLLVRWFGFDEELVGADDHTTQILRWARWDTCWAWRARCIWRRCASRTW